MAQRSKKDHIIATALPLFLENGFKGTSIDLVVKTCRVSKPTVYNHFPDKAALMLAVVARWIDDNKPLILPIRNPGELDEFVRVNWFTPEAVRFYALIIGEGRRFPEAKRLFWNQYDGLWRQALTYVSDHSIELDQASIEQRLDQHLMNRLRAL